jgi:hypothetical protein
MVTDAADVGGPVVVTQGFGDGVKIHRHFGLSVERGFHKPDAGTEVIMLPVGGHILRMRPRAEEQDVLFADLVRALGGGQRVKHIGQPPNPAVSTVSTSDNTSVLFVSPRTMRNTVNMAISFVNPLSL